ncbi:MAG: hypothetical protein K2U26_08320 [Cyclobacteriaceae bacterium]|nr:hypothetical protein [Cyclobacteriaceae bacterium]
MKYPFNTGSLDRVSTSSIDIDVSLRRLVCGFLLRIEPNKINIDQSYVDIDDGSKPYIEIKIVSSENLNIPFQMHIYNNDFELWIGSEGSAVIEPFTVIKKSEYESLKKEISKWLECKIKEILFFKDKNIFKTVYKYFDGKKFRSLYFEIDFVNMFWRGRREEKIYEPWID